MNPNAKKNLEFGRKVLAAMRPTADERFWGSVDKNHITGCWMWLGYKRCGYGMFGYGGRKGRRIGAHRYAYQKLKGDIPDGMVLDHLCRQRDCVNPDHLEPVTQKENCLRGFSPMARQARQEHCKRGHSLSGDNLYITPKGRRQCRLCRKQAMKRYYEGVKCQQK